MNESKTIINTDIYQLLLKIIKLLSDAEIKLGNIRFDILNYLSPLYITEATRNLFSFLSSDDAVKSETLLSFLKRNNVFVNFSSLKKIVSFYDCDNDGVLNLTEFETLVLGNDSQLKVYKNSSQGVINKIKRKGSDANLIHIVVNILMKEMDFSEDLIKLNKNILAIEPNFSARDLFISICGEQEDHQRIYLKE
jgi:hypothetical protein